MYLLLILSFIALLAGPLLCNFATRYTTLLKFLDAFVICSIVSLVLFHILPESIYHGGIIAIIAATVGLLGPLVISKIYHESHCQVHRSLISVASLGLFAHAILDGMALASFYPDNVNQTAFLGFAVVLHRLPEGVGIWRVTQSNLGKKAGIYVLAFVMIATIMGFFFGESWLTHSSEKVLTVFEALMAGVLLHVIFHSHHLIQMKPRSGEQINPQSPWSTGAGAFCGFLLVICLSVAPSAHHHDKPTSEFALDPTVKQDIMCEQKTS